MISYVEDMVTFTTCIGEIYSTEYCCKAKVAGFGEILSSKNFGYTVINHTLPSTIRAVIGTLAYESIV